MMEEQFLTRQTLLDRVRARDDEKSWEEFTRYYQEFMYLICRRMSLSHCDAEEVVQKVIVKLWNKLPEMDCSNFRRFRSWLCRIVGNEVKDFLRRRKTRTNNENLAGKPLTDYSEPDIERIAEEEWKSYLVSLAMERIERSCSSISVSVFKELHNGVSRDDIAEKYGIPVGSVPVYKHRVLNALCCEIRHLEATLH